MVRSKNFSFIFGFKYIVMEKKGNKDLDLSNEVFSALQAELRDLDTNWVATLEKQILADRKVSQDYKNDLSARKIYNVFHDIVRNKGWKVLIYSQGVALRDKLKKEFEKAIN